MYPVYTLGPAAHELLPDLLRLWDQPLAPDQKYQLADAILTVDRDKGQRALKWLRDEARTTTGYAGVNLLRILVRQDAKNPDVLRWIRRAVNDPSPWISAQAVQLLGQMGEAGRPALGELRALLKDSYLPRRVNAAVALWQIEHKPDELVMVLSDALTQVDDPRVVTATPGRTAAHLAALALGEMGAAAKPALPALRTAATLGDSMLAQNATRSIALIEKAK
jgi:HEAT repeat protein